MEILAWILSFGNHVEVLQPGELREEVRRVAGKMASIYERGQEQSTGSDSPGRIT